MDEQMRKERAEATHRARAAAWEAEKADAQANRVSSAPLLGAPNYVSKVCTALSQLSQQAACVRGASRVHEGAEKSASHIRRS